MSPDASLTRMTRTDPRTVATWAVAGVNVLSTGALVVLIWVLGSVGDQPEELRGQLPVIPLILVSTWVAVLILRKDRTHVVGWVLLGLGTIGALVSVTMHYSYLAIVVRTLPAGHVAAWATWVLALFGLASFPILPLMFPDGRLPSRRWKALLWSVGAALVLSGPVAVAVEEFTITTPWAANPFHVDLGTSVANSLLFGLALLVAANLIAAGISVIARYRISGPMERRQIKWFAYGTSILVVAHAAILLADVPFVSPPVAEVLSDIGIVAPASTLLLVVTVGIAILRYRLYDIDLVISRTLVYGALAGLIGAVYVAVVVGIGRLVGTRGQPDTTLTLAATVVVAILFQPARQRLQRLANRVVFGERANPYEVLADFSRRLGGALDAQTILPRIAETAALASSASWAQTHVFLPHDRTRHATWPDHAPTSPHDTHIALSHTIPIHHRGQRIGEIHVAKPPGDPLQDHERRLLEQLAHQSAMALHNARLTAQLEDRLQHITHQADQLRASRQRLLEARHRERHRVEAEITRRTGPAITAVRTLVRHAATTLHQDPTHAGQLLERARQHAQSALDELRDIARGIYPPLLADRGLITAIEADLRRQPLPITLDTDIPPHTRLPPHLEATAYFCTREALNNAIRHADATRIDIHIALHPARLHLTVTDDGTGFDPTTPHRGTGLQLMADRITAIDGQLDINSRPGRTTILARLPVPDHPAATPPDRPEVVLTPPRPT